MSTITCDFHTHILPGIDDGAKTVDDSMKLIDELVTQGVTDICLTPHFYTNQESAEDFISRRENALSLIKNQLPDGINIHTGAEVFVTDYLFAEDFNTELCYQGTDLLLCEFNYSSSFDGTSLDYIYRLINNCSVTPVIAHIERYKTLLAKQKIRNNLLSAGVLFQINAKSLMEPKYSHKLLKMIKNGEISFLGTDTHSITRNPPSDFSLAVELIKSKLGESYAKAIQNKSQDAFS